jgi:hypothetical protein
MAVFCDVALCSLVDFADVLEVRSAYLIRVTSTRRSMP